MMFWSCLEMEIYLQTLHVFKAPSNSDQLRPGVWVTGGTDPQMVGHWTVWRLTILIHAIWEKLKWSDSQNSAS